MDPSNELFAPGTERWDRIKLKLARGPPYSPRIKRAKRTANYLARLSTTPSTLSSEPRPPSNEASLSKPPPQAIGASKTVKQEWAQPSQLQGISASPRAPSPQPPPLDEYTPASRLKKAKRPPVLPPSYLQQQEDQGLSPIAFRNPQALPTQTSSTQYPGVLTGEAHYGSTETSRSILSTRPKSIKKPLRMILLKPATLSRADNTSLVSPKASLLDLVYRFGGRKIDINGYVVNEENLFIIASGCFTPAIFGLLIVITSVPPSWIICLPESHPSQRQRDPTVRHIASICLQPGLSSGEIGLWFLLHVDLQDETVSCYDSLHDTHRPLGEHHHQAYAHVIQSLQNAGLIDGSQGWESQSIVAKQRTIVQADSTSCGPLIWMELELLLGLQIPSRETATELRQRLVHQVTPFALPSKVPNFVADSYISRMEGSAALPSNNSPSGAGKIGRRAYTRRNRWSSKRHTWFSPV